MKDIKDIKNFETDTFVSDLYAQNIKYYNELAGEDSQFDLLKLYFGEDYKINENITIHQPTIQDVIDMGEKEFYKIIVPFTSNPTSLKVQLFDLGIYWSDISDFELFALLIKTVSLDDTKIIFGDVDFSSFDLVAYRNEDDTLVPILFSPKMNFEINEKTFYKIRDYLCFMFDIKIEREIVKNKALAAEIIAKERADLAKNKAELKDTTPLIQMISFALNHPGFKYKKNELREVGYVEFIDSIKRLQVYETTKALTQGNYSGFCDMSKIPKENFNFLRKLT